MAMDPDSPKDALLKNAAKTPVTPWGRLVQCASLSPDTPSTASPGFISRVLAQGSWRPQRLPENNPWPVRELVAWRGAWIATAITAVTMAVNYDLLLGLWYGDTALAGSLLQAFAVP